MLRKIIKNILLLIVEHGARIVSSLLITAILARQLTIEDYGYFQYALNLVMVFSSFCFVCGAEVLVPSLVNVDSNNRKKILLNVFYIRAIASLIAYALLIVFAFSFNNENFYLFLILGLILILGEPFQIVTAVLQADTNIEPKIKVTLFSLFIKLSLLISLYFLNIKDEYLFSIAWVLEYLSTALGLFLIFYIKYGNPVGYFDKKIFLIYLKKGLPFFYSLLAMYLFIRMDMLMLKKLGTEYELGLYSASVQLGLVVTAISPILVMSLAPSLVYKHAVEAVVKRNVIIIALLMFIFSITLVLLLHIILPYIINLLLGDKFKNSYDILYWYLLASSFLFLDNGLNIYIMKINKGYLAGVKWLLSLVVALMLYWIFIPKYGSYGAVIGYFGGYLTASIIGIFYVFFISMEKE